MRVLALDHGTKRIGLAISDPTATIGQPLGYWPAAPFSKFLDRLKALIQEKKYVSDDRVIKPVDPESDLKRMSRYWPFGA